MLSLNDGGCFFDLPLPSGRVRERVGWFGEGGFIGALVGVVSVGGGVGRKPRHSGFRLTKNITLSDGFSEASKNSTLMLPRA